MKHVSVATALLVLAPLAAFAAEPTLDVQLSPERIGVEDAARLTIKITEPPSGLEQPELGQLTNLRVVAGPSRGSEFSFINGVATSAVTFSYVLRAEEVGTASIGPITVRAGDIELRAELIATEGILQVFEELFP